MQQINIQSEPKVSRPTVLAYSKTFNYNYYIIIIKVGYIHRYAVNQILL